MGCLDQTWPLRTIVNGFMTFLFFFTQYPDHMKDSIRIAFDHRMKARIYEVENERCAEAAHVLNLRFGEGDPMSMFQEDMSPEQRQKYDLYRHFREKCIKDIANMVHKPISDDLALYSYDQLFMWRKTLLEKHVALAAEDPIPTPAWMKFSFAVLIFMIMWSMDQRMVAASCAIIFILMILKVAKCFFKSRSGSVKVPGATERLLGGQ